MLLFDSTLTEKAPSHIKLLGVASLQWNKCIMGIKNNTSWKKIKTLQKYTLNFFLNWTTVSSYAGLGSVSKS